MKWSKYRVGIVQENIKYLFEIWLPGEIVINLQQKTFAKMVLPRCPSGEAGGSAGIERCLRAAPLRAT
ncbi:hypothetical protein [Sphingomonas gei]|uniref:hypothetical protein n=1 Tax=Sphingomonas gei TaxID=1395960 RepID=UPI0014429BB3|nr:hypothetical protein [Sphingomonas gei]